MLQVFLLASVVAASVFAIMNLKRDHFMLAGLEFFIAAYSLVTLIYMKQRQDRANLELISLIYVLLFCGFLTYAFASPRSSDSIHIWALVIPLISYLLLGVKWGFIFTAVFYSLAAWFFLARFSGHPMMAEDVSYANVFFSSSLFWILSHAYEYSNQRSRNKLRNMAVLDHLTGLHNRILLDRIYREKLAVAMQQDIHLGMILFDLDHFKSINDDHGHATGDQVLIEFAAIMNKVFNDQGAAFRIGGEEFLVLLALTNIADAECLAEQVRNLTGAIKIKNMSGRQVTVSAGIATNEKQDMAVDDLLKSADKRLYQAKQSGRNRVVSEDLKA